MKITKEWSKINEKNYIWLFNYMKALDNNIDEYTFIDDHKRKIMSLIENNNKWSDSSKEALLFTVAKYLKLWGNNEKYGKLYSQKGFEYMQKTKLKEAENKQTENEIENYRDHQYFIHILNNINETDIMTLNGHYQYLLLSLLTYQPPLRTDFYTTCKFIRTKAEDNKVDNFLRIDRRGTIKCYYIVNNDKVSNTKVYSMNKTLSTIEINNKSLCELINNSFIKYPREFLFEVNEKPITQPTLLNWLRQITKVNGINIDIMRSSYITWFYEKNKTLAKREALANMMRHSTTTAQRNYYKVPTDEAETSDETVLQLKQKLYELQSKCNDDNTKEDPKLYNKRRNDILYNSNTKNRAVKETTLRKYGIKYDDIIKKYV